MTFSITPADLKSASDAGTQVRLNEAVTLITKFVDSELSAHVAKVQAGQIAIKNFQIRVDPAVSKRSEKHIEAMKEVVGALVAEGFSATYHEEPDYDDGPNRSSAGYSYIEIKL